MLLVVDVVDVLMIDGPESSLYCVPDNVDLIHVNIYKKFAYYFANFYILPLHVQ